MTEKLNKVIAKEKMIEEIKWQKVNTFHLERYKKIMDVFFRLIKQNKIKLRIMFTQNANVAKNLQTHHVENEYFLLYYQFFKHSFGLRYSILLHLPSSGFQFVFQYRNSIAGG